MNKKSEIRVFISSTFLDMHEERDYLNRIIFPKLRKQCAERGVSFYAIDLRWGVTEEESRLNRTIDVCLDQVKQSIPFFIGLIGNRYGWIPNQVSIIEKYPWIEKYGSISATEMEIRYYLQEAKTSKDYSFFAVKGSSLCDLEFDDGHSVELQRLTDFIYCETGREPYIYESVEALGAAVYENIFDILEKLYPAQENTSAFRLKRYLREMDGYDDSSEFQRMEIEKRSSGGNPFLFARRDPMAVEVMERTLLRFKHMLLLETAGTELLSNRYIHHALHRGLCYSNPKLKSILLMLDADEDLCTPLAILEGVCARLRSYVHNEGVYCLPDDTYGVERLQLLQKIIVELLKELSDQEFLICITNLHLLDSASPWYCLSFLVPLFQDNVRLVLTTSDPGQTELMELFDVPVRNYPIVLATAERAGFIGGIIRSLELEGKHLENELAERLLESSCLKDMDSALFFATYLKNYVLFEELSATVDSILSCVEELGIYEAVWQHHWQKMTDTSEFDNDELLQIFQTVGAIFHVLRFMRIDEATLYQIFTKYTDVSKIMYLTSFEQLRPFLVYVDGGMSICNRACAEALLKTFDKSLCSCIGKGLVDVVLENVEVTWRNIDRSYALLRYLTDTNDMNQIIRLVTSNSWLGFVQCTDHCLLRMGWRVLQEKELLDVKKIYTESNHINSHFNMTAGLPIYDLLLRMENSVSHTNSIECFMDIPYAYTSDADKEQKKDWTQEDYMVWQELRKKALSWDDDELRSFPEQYEKTYEAKKTVLAFLYEIVCKVLVKRGSIEVGDVLQYIRYACECGNLRLIADSIYYTGMVDDIFKYLW